MADDQPNEFIPLLQDDPTRTLWKERRDMSGDPHREPGLLDLRRYELELKGQGVASFYQQPLGFTQADLRAAEVDVAILGAGVDFSIGMRGTAFGPRASAPTTCTCPIRPWARLTRT